MIAGQTSVFSAKGDELPLGLLPFRGLQSDRGLENFGGIVMRAKAPFDPIGWSRFDLWASAVSRKRRTGPAGDRRTTADRAIIGRTPYFRRAEIFFPIALRELTIGPACMRGRSE